MRNAHVAGLITHMHADDSTAVFRSFGKVFKALHHKSGVVVAVKIVPLDDDAGEVYPHAHCKPEPVLTHALTMSFLTAGARDSTPERVRQPQHCHVSRLFHTCKSTVDHDGVL